MRIVHVIARLNLGGAALSVLELAAGQRDHGHDVLVVAGTIPPGEASMEGVADDLGVPYLRAPALTRELSARHDLRATLLVRTLLRERRPDVLHTHTSKAGATGRVAALVAGRARPKAVVHTFHGHVLSGYFDSRRERVFRVIERSLALTTDRIIAVSAQVRDDLLHFHIARDDKIAVIRYGFALDQRLVNASRLRDAKRGAIGAAEDDFVIGWAGRMSEIKRPLDLVLTAERVPGSFLVLAGDGELRGSVEDLVARLKLGDRVKLLGYIEDLGDWYGAFDAFLLTSANEGAPVVAIEALAASRPVVATDAGGTRTVVDDGESGYIAAIGDVEELARRLRQLRDDVDLRHRLGETGAVRVRERFSVARMVNETEALYADILRR